MDKHWVCVETQPALIKTNGDLKKMFTVGQNTLKYDLIVTFSEYNFLAAVQFDIIALHCLHILLLCCGRVCLIC